MSDLLNQASLVMVPSGYKEDTVYSVVPSDGSGDLSFTRASNGTRVNSAGLVEVCPWNLVQQSNTFNVTWVSGGPGGTVTSGQTDPNGGSNAWLLSKLGQTGRIEQTINVGGVQTFFIYAKKNTSDFILINVYDGTTSHECWFNLSTGVVGTQNASTGAIESVGNGWYKCSVTSTNLFASGIIQLYQSENNGVVTGTTGSIYIFNSQLNIGSTAKPYFPTTDRLNVPRLTYQNGGGGCPSLLLEKQSTNLITYSEQFDNAAFSTANNNGTVTRTANYGISPDGTQNADRIQLTRGSGSFDYAQVYQQVSTTSGTHTFSCWIKSLSGTPSIGWAYDGAVWNVVTLTNEWVRYTWTTSTSTTPSANLIIYGSLATPLSADFLVWGYQIEQNSYPTSYIPTTSSSATRVVDVCSKTGISSLIGQTEGVMFLDFVFTNTNDVQVIMSLHDNANNKRVEIWANAANLYGFVCGSSPFNIASVTATNGARYKVAVAYKSGDSAYYVNGSQIGTNSTTFTIGLTSLIFDFWGQGYLANSKINQAVIFPTRLTNAELASLTTI